MGRDDRIDVSDQPALPLLTSLRFFAASEVVLYHATFSWKGVAGTDNFLRALVSAGYEVVTFFFVLSGFILTYVYAGRHDLPEGGRLDTRRFLRFRFARLAPAYYLALLLAVPIVARDVTSGHLSGPATVVGLAAVLLFVQAWWPAFASLWNVPAWSLSVEFFFYTLFPRLVGPSARLPPLALLVATYALDLAVLLFLRSLGQARAEAYFSFFPLVHLPQFLFGMALGRCFLSGPALSDRASAALLIAGAVWVVLTFGLAPRLPWWASSNAALAIPFGMVVFGGARARSVLPWLAAPPLVLLGEASYAIYILHHALRHWWNYLSRDVLGVVLSPRLDLVLFFATVCGISVLSFLYFEMPLRRLLLARRAQPAQALRPGE